MLALSVDLFSNYVIQKCFEVAGPSDKLAMVKALEGHVLSLSLQVIFWNYVSVVPLNRLYQMYGCRVVQKARQTMPARFNSN